MPPVAGVSLSGRTLTVASNEQLVLRPREVVLTFDDGPRPGKTEAILNTLDRYGVKATFLMLGETVEQHPALARTVAQRGHTVGSHTFTHTNLTTLAFAEAMAEMQKGHEAVARALAGSGFVPSRFFRFPYLAQTGFIRASAIESHLIILDVDIDSKDYYKDSARTVMERTLARLDAQGQGIILFHDIHMRTVTMLPDFLEALQERGYKVVTLRSTGGTAFDTPLVTAGTNGSSTTL
nr:polysaccharide deacetylase family protein [Pelagibacterium limicola]